MQNGKVFCVCAFVFTLLQNGVTQSDNMMSFIPPQITTPVYVASDVICDTCTCELGSVECANKSIKEPFKIWDWDALKTMEPTKVDLSNNDFRSITRFATLNIQYLNLSSCNIEKIEDASFQYLENLTSLDLSRNYIATEGLNKKIFAGRLLPDITAKSFDRLQYLNLAYNDIHSLPQDLFMSTPRINYLDLSGNPLVFIDKVTMGAVSDLTGLEEIRLSKCDLESLPEGLLRRQRRLKRLDLSDNKFKKLPSVLQESVSLKFLNFDGNSLTSLDSETSTIKIPNLEEISISRQSKLQNITKSGLGGMQNLVVLRLSHNPRLTTIDPFFLMSEVEDGEEWPMIRELYLNNNNITTIDSRMLDSWGSLMNADFSNNPLTCDCTNQWIVAVLIPLLSTTEANSTIDGMVCKMPADVRGLTFRQLYASSQVLTCSDNEKLTEQPVSNMAMILGFVIGILMTFPIVLVVVLLWKRGYFARCRSRKVEYYHDDDDDEARYL